MSAEYMSEYDDSTVGTAIGKMEQELYQVEYVLEYVDAIESKLEKTEDGKAEILQLIRAAQVITGNGGNDYNDDVKAFYQGELLGLELINSFDTSDDAPLRSGYAHTFLKYQLDQDRPAGLEPLETVAENRERLAQLAIAIQEDLSYPIDSYHLSSVYEEFGKKVTSKLNDTERLKLLSLMGYRMVVVQALLPYEASQNFADATYALLDAYPVPEGSQRSETDHAPQRTSIADLAQKYEYSIEHTESIIGPQEGIVFDEWQQVSHIRKLLHNTYLQLNSQSKDQDILSIPTEATVNQAILEKIQAFNVNRNLVNTGDLLSIIGELCAVHSGEKHPFVYEENTEIRGTFDSFQIVDVPTNKRLLQIMKSNDVDECDETYYQPTLAIRLNNPVFTFEKADGERKPEYAGGETVDIPLNYKNVALWRIPALPVETAS
jgi:hypothetical protein